MSTETHLAGLTPASLSGYLSAVGLFRVLSEQLDETVRASWAGDHLVISGVPLEEIEAFLLNDFVPSPVYSPWNGTAQAGPSTNIRKLAASDQARFDAYRRVIEAWDSDETLVRIANDLVGAKEKDKARQKNQELEVKTEKGKKSADLKVALVARWRSCAPDEALGWLDAAIVLGDKLTFPPLLGTGGNDGRAEFAKLDHDCLVKVWPDGVASADAHGWLHSLLTGAPGPNLLDVTFGMYDSASAGSPNSTPEGKAVGAANPWAIILACEGLIAFGGSVVSRLGGAHRSLAGAPFTITAPTAEQGGPVGPRNYGEFWAPLWSRPAGWAELRRIISEGRIAWSGQQARFRADAARAVSSLGVQRGVEAFVPYEIAERNGQSRMATPRDRVIVRSVPSAGSLEVIDPWLKKVGGAGTPGLAGKIREINDLLGSASMEGDSRERVWVLQRLLCALSDAERLLGRLSGGNEKPEPFHLLPDYLSFGEREGEVEEWINAADDGTPEFRLARAVASLEDPPSNETNEQSRPYPTMALALRGLGGAPSRPKWATTGEQRDVDAARANAAGNGAAAEVLRRRLETSCQSVGHHGQLRQARPGYIYGQIATLGDVVALLNGEVDIDRTLLLAKGLALFCGGRMVEQPPEIPVSPHFSEVDPWFAATRLCFGVPEKMKAERGNFSDDNGPARDRWEAIQTGLPRKSWGRLCQLGRFDQVGASALAILGRAGVTRLRNAHAPSADPRSVAVSLLVRLHPASYSVLEQVLGDSTPRPRD